MGAEPSQFGRHGHRPLIVPRQRLAGWRWTWEASMWVSWVVARRVVVGLLLVALACVGLVVMLLLLSVSFLD
jgi:hypothetical protein